MLLDIRADHLKIVQDILQKHVPTHEVWAFGSRAKWLSKEYSDLDLCILAEAPLSFLALAKLEEDFDESDLPYKVDVVDWATTSESFRKIIERDKVVVQTQKSGWKKISVDQVCELIVDCVNKTAPTVPVPTPYKMVRTTNIRNGRIDLSDCRFVEPDVFRIWTRRAQVLPGDILLTREAPIGEVGFVNFQESIFLGQRIMQYRVDPQKMEPRFLFYAFTSPELKNQFGAHEGSGSVVSHIRVGDCFKFQVPVPSLREQRIIAHVLGTLDDKIDLNRRINQTLEAMAQAIFKSWFVDFDPVKAKIAAKQALTPALSQREREEKILRAAMRAISGKTDAELDALPREHYDPIAATAALFPDEMEESALGEIPRGWKFKSIANITKFTSRKVEVSSLNLDTYISTENMQENRGGIGRAASLPSVPAVPSFFKGQVLVSNIRPYFKKIWLARFCGGRSNDVLAFEATENDCTEFLYNLLYQDEFFEFMMRTSKGAKMPRGDKDAIAGWTFPCADHALRRLFSENVRPYYSYIESLNTEAQHLSATRDTLLPKLLSGELSVSQINKEVSA